MKSRSPGRLWLSLLLLLAAALILLQRGRDPGDDSGADSRAGRADSTARLPQELTEKSWTALLRHVVDGDSFEVESMDGTRVGIRMVGIDAPEMDSPQGAPAREHARHLLETATLISIEPEPSGAIDKHGRILAWVWLTLPHSSGRLLLNEEMVRNAQVPLFRYANPGMKYYQRLVAASDAPAVSY